MSSAPPGCACGPGSERPAPSCERAGKVARGTGCFYTCLAVVQIFTAHDSGGQRAAVSFSSAHTITMPVSTPRRKRLPALGWREWLALPDLGISAIRAKIDSGARSSALHVEHLSTHLVDGREWVRFGVRAGSDDTITDCDAPVLHRRHVTDSGGHVTERVFIRTTLRLGHKRYAIDINLTDRRNMLFPMLLGRTAMAGRWIVDPGRSYLLGGDDVPHVREPLPRPA